MRVIIVGFGRVGRHTAAILTEEGHDVVVIDSEPAAIERANEDGYETVEGDGGDEEVLRQAGVQDADALGALTGDLNTNFAACVVGDTHGCRTVLRVSEDVNKELYERYSDNVDEVIYPERFGAVGAKTALLGGDFNVLADITDDLSVASIAVPDGSPVIGERVIELTLPGQAQIYAHGRVDEPMTIPLPQTTLQAGDSLAVVTDPDTLPDVRATLRGEA